MVWVVLLQMSSRGEEEEEEEGLLLLHANRRGIPRGNTQPCHLLPRAWITEWGATHSLSPFFPSSSPSSSSLLPSSRPPYSIIASLAALLRKTPGGRVERRAEGEKSDGGLLNINLMKMLKSRCWFRRRKAAKRGGVKNPLQWDQTWPQDRRRETRSVCFKAAKNWIPSFFY